MTDPVSGSPGSEDIDARWRAQIARELRGKQPEDLSITLEDGICVPPLLTGRDLSGLDVLEPVPGHGLNARGFDSGDQPGGWSICAESRAWQPGQLEQEARQEQGRGASMLWCSIARDPGAPTSRARGCWRLDETAQALSAAAATGLTVQVDAGPVFTPLASAFERERLAARGCAFGVDLWSELASCGNRACSTDVLREELREGARWCGDGEDRQLRWICSTVPFHDAGATRVQELGLLMALLVGTLRELETTGIDFDTALDHFDLRVSVGRDVFAEIAKLRAARVLWSQIMGSSGFGVGQHRPRLLARSAWRERTAIDPWTNLLRGTTESFAAAVGGADVITTLPMHHVLGGESELGGRLATNTQVLLARESHLGRVLDAGGGSYYIEWLTEKMAREGWKWFRRVEEVGGIERALTEGVIDGWMSTAADAREADVRTRACSVVGVSDFASSSVPEIPDLTGVSSRGRGRSSQAGIKWSRSRPVVSRASVLKDLCIDEAREAMMRVASVSPSCRPLRRRRLSEPFEHLAAKVARELPGAQAWVVSVGDGAVVSARRDFAANALAAAGVEPIRVAYGAWNGTSAEGHAGDTVRRYIVLCAEDTELDASLARRVEELRSAGRGGLCWRGGRRGVLARTRSTDFYIRGSTWSPGSAISSLVPAGERRADE